MLFEDAVSIIFKNEGGYANDPLDKGGATNLGITQSTFNAYNRAHHLEKKEVRNITVSEAAKIYHDNYWLEGRCDKLPTGLDLCHFDACVNHGTHQAGLFLQRAVGSKDDGVVGPLTIKAALSQDPIKSINRYHAERIEFYQRLVRQDPTQLKFQNGWNHRADKMKNLALEEYQSGSTNT